MTKPRMLNGKPFIQIGEVYEIKGVLHKVITATTKIMDARADSVAMTEHVYWLDNLETNERLYIGETELKAMFI
ncbi:hypothetical protein [Bacillus sp. 1P06AnD]|uniref:hypothetical protein n=1 Tax=Bacillus sp. 1P06AnD TaxID=3132208 RepID=UPI00399F9C6D